MIFSLTPKTFNFCSKEVEIQKSENFGTKEKHLKILNDEFRLFWTLYDRRERISNVCF